MAGRHGDWWVICDICGFKVRRRDARKNWRGLIVCKDDFEIRNQQELIRPIHERFAVPDPRPRTTAVFIDPTETIEL